MRILVVCYCYPPDIGPRAFRWSAVAAHWAGQGHEVHVVNGRKPGAVREERLDGVHVHRVGGAFVDNLRTWIERRRRPVGGGDTRLAGESLGGQEFTSTLGLLKRLHDLTWRKVYWPESTCLWFFPARRETLRLLAAQRFDAVISTSTPYTGHLVGRAAKRRFPEVHWMVDIGDPFAFNVAPEWNNTRLYGGLNHRSEEAVLSDADSISVTVESCLAEYVRAFPRVDIRAKAAVIPPLMAGRPAPASPRVRAPGGPRRLVFTGSLYRDIRSPDYLLRLIDAILARRPATEVHFFGRLNDCMACFEPYRRHLGQGIVLHGPVDRDSAMAAIGDADVLVNIGNATPYQLPSKVVDYLASGRPILNLVTDEADSSLAVLSAYPAHLALRETADGPSPEDVEKAAVFIETPPEVGGSFLEGFLKPFRTEAIADAYLRLIAGHRAAGTAGRDIG